MKNFWRLFYALLITGSLLAVLSCGPSVSGETKRWDGYNKLVDTSMTNYPAFGKFFDQKRKEIKTAWDALGSIADEKEKSKQMREVNNTLAVIAIKLGEFEVAARNIPKVIPKIQALFDNNLSKYPDLKRYTMQFEEYSRQGITASQKAKEMVLTAFPTDYDGALQIFTNAWRLQQESYDNLNKLYDEVDNFIKKKLDEEQEKKKEAEKPKK